MNEIIEEWQPIEGYGGLYQVSNYGRVKSLKDRYGNPREKILKQIKMKNDYLQVNLYKEGKMKHYFVHRLVANAFIPNYNNYTCVNHKDEDKANNCVENLEWCSNKYNSNYGTCQQRKVKNTDYKEIGRKNAEKLTNGVRSKQVYQYTKDGTLVAIWTSTRECQRNGYNQGNVATCCRGELKSYKGFIWSYTELDKKQEN